MKRQTSIVIAVILGVAVPASADSGKDYGAPDSAVCPTTDAKLPAPEILAKLVQCFQEGGSGHDYYLLRQVQVQVGSPRRAIYGDGDGEIDVSLPVYPIRGSFIRYQCDYSNAGSQGHNCYVYNQPHATGECWRTTFNEWKCRMADNSAAAGEAVQKNVGPPPE